MDYRIESHRGGMQSIEPGTLDVADGLREVLRDMEALLRVARGEGSAADVARLYPPADVERLEVEPDAVPMDAVLAWVDSWALDVQASNTRVTILLDMGDPHIELDILCIPSTESYAVEEVILRRSWPSAHDRAWTTDDRALDVVEDFLDLIGRH